MAPYSFTLIDPQTKEMALKISSFTDGADFSSFGQYNYFSVLLITKGIGKVIRDHSTYEFGQNNLLCFSLYQPFLIQPEDCLEGILINFHPSFFCLFKHRNEVACNGVLFNNIYDTPVVALTRADREALLLTAGQIKNEMQLRPLPDEELLIACLKIFLINASRAKMSQRERSVADNKKQPAILALQAAIETHFKQLRSPAAYGELLHISPKVLNTASKVHFNKTLTSLIAERVILEAKRELYLTAKSIKEIAFDLNYRDEFYFSRFFKKNVGLSPQLFRDKVGFDKLTV
jgi:AraC family transcriptional activator of pobA